MNFPQVISSMSIVITTQNPVWSSISLRLSLLASPQCWYNAFFSIIMLSNTHNKPYYLYRCQKIYAICVQTLKRSNPILRSFRESIQKLRFATTLTGSKQFNFDLLEDWFLTYFDLFTNFNIDIGLQNSVGKYSH